MTNIFTFRCHYPRHESYRSQYLPLQLQIINSMKTKENQSHEIVKNFSTIKCNNPHIQSLSKDNQKVMNWSLFTTYKNDYRLWSQSEMKASRGQRIFTHDQVAESSAPELPIMRMITKRYSLPNVTLPIPVRCCCKHSKQWRDPCLTQTQIDYWKNLSCCGIVHQNEFGQSNEQELKSQ